MVMALYAIAELIEARAVDRARNAIKGLVDLAPDEADIQQADGSWQRMKATDIALNAIARVKPGERVATSGLLKLRNDAVVTINNRVQPSADAAPTPENR